ncbi:ABC transporter ATP-binding protein/permease [Tissierella sp. MSJ-40]|uniref:ABC transporter ATP-binding protein/permease n=1 Tax=Tissierella simiarum TaxID=2841534 RepID=A0ABS6E2R9_9FIRM|nr:ABC transporter ATP-binding protein [Tissierella simiarum]MBU5436881.1 ABC transporter ATP-binding protein/permease [Tissierella simiarum]
MFKLAHFLKPYKKEVILGPFFKLLEAIFELMIPTLMALIIDNGIKLGDKSYILKIGSIMILMAIIGMGCAFTCQYYAAKASQGFGTKIRKALFQHIGTLSYSEIDTIGTSSLINRITNDVNQLQLAVAMLIRLVIRAPFLCIGGLIMAMILDFKLSIVIIFLLPIFTFILYLIMYKSVPLYKTVQKKLDNLAQTLRENLSGVRVVRAFAKIDYEKTRFEYSNKNLTEDMIKVGNISSLLNPATALITNFAVLAVIWYGGFRINIGEMTQGQVIAFINYINLIVLALIVVANLVIIFTRASASAARVNEILEMEPSINDPSISNDYISLKDSNNVVEFRNVSFYYKNSKEPTLKDISFNIKTGDVVGIVGVTGSGKSTLLNLIPRFYDTFKGTVLVNGIDVKEYPQEELRKKIGLVPQKSVLFSGTISENIRWGLENATVTEVQLAAEISQASDFIEDFPDKYNTVLSQGGVNLSGGQRQRIAIARALVGKPEILILDDSLSALDYSTDAALRKSLKENIHNASIIIVSQRVSAVKNSDSIIVLDDGKIVGIGNHDSLMESCITYREIYLSQLDRKENTYGSPSFETTF